MTGPRPPAASVALAALFALACVASFALGRFDDQWVAFWGLFLVLEVTGAISCAKGDTLSERVWEWIGLRPLRPARLWRVPGVAVFLFVLAAHFVTAGALWWTGGPAVIVTSLPVALAVALGWREARA